MSKDSFVVRMAYLYHVDGIPKGDVDTLSLYGMFILGIMMYVGDLFVLQPMKAVIWLLGWILVRPVRVLIALSLGTWPEGSGWRNISPYGHKFGPCRPIKNWPTFDDGERVTIIHVVLLLFFIWCISTTIDLLGFNRMISWIVILSVRLIGFWFVKTRTGRTLWKKISPPVRIE